jgi:hypothetical protein
MENNQDILTSDCICNLFIDNSVSFIDKLNIKTKSDVLTLVLSHPDIATNYIWCGLKHIINGIQDE